MGVFAYFHNGSRNVAGGPPRGCSFPMIFCRICFLYKLKVLNTGRTKNIFLRLNKHPIGGVDFVETNHEN